MVILGFVQNVLKNLQESIGVLMICNYCNRELKLDDLLINIQKDLIYISEQVVGSTKDYVHLGSNYYFHAECFVFVAGKQFLKNCRKQP
jgi:hypothetical protein